MTKLTSEVVLNLASRGDLPIGDGLVLAATDPVKVEGAGGLSVDLNMVILTWVTFLILFLLLWKFAFSKIFKQLDAREATIRKSVEDADRLKNELADIENKRQAVLNEAEDRAKAMIADARKAAVEAARVIEEKAREEAQIQLENARREINAARDSARAQLRKEAADLAIGVAGKIVRENLDDSKNRALTDQLISQMQGKGK